MRVQTPRFLYMQTPRFDYMYIRRLRMSNMRVWWTKRALFYVFQSYCIEKKAVRSFTPTKLRIFQKLNYLKLFYLGRVVDECKDMLHELKDRSVSLRSIRRSANKVAHYIARYSFSPADRRWRGDNVHSDLLYVLSNDLRN